jgi:glyoxylase-like metal-dependent hydrolase (beta-lactamase superfamily II)
LKAGKALAWLMLFCLLPSLATAQTKEIPEWCRALPRPEYKTLERVLPSEAWFEVYKVSPVVVLNSHTHDDHVGGNWQFAFVYGMDTQFTRTNAKGSREDAQAEITPDQLCGDLPKGFNPKTYATKPWKISRFIHDGFRINLGGRTMEVLSTPGHTPDAISLIDRENGLLFTGDTYYPAPIWLFRPETNLDEYAGSVKRLADLAPQVKLVLGAHNIPVANPDVLPRLVAAFQTLREGKVPPQKSEGGKTLYTVDGISFLMKAGAVGVH